MLSFRFTDDSTPVVNEESIETPAEQFLYLSDGEIQMTFHPMVLGTFEIDVQAAPSLTGGPFLRFETRADQSYLPAWIASIDAVMRAWPGSAEAANGSDSD